MNTISNPTDVQLTRLMNLIAMPAIMDEESIGDRFDFEDGNGKCFIPDFLDWLKNSDPKLHSRIKREYTDEYFNVQYGFWPEPNGDTGKLGYDAFRKCAEYIYTHASALEGVCEEIRKFTEDDEYLSEYEFWGDTPYDDKDDFLADADVLFKEAGYDVSEKERIVSQKIFNGTLPDAKPGRKAPKITGDDLLSHLISALSWNEQRLLTVKDFMKKNPPQIISRNGPFMAVMSGSPDSLDEAKIRDVFSKKFVSSNPAFSKVFSDLSKIDLELGAPDTYTTYMGMIDYHEDFIPYIYVTAGKGPGWFAQKTATDRLMDDIYGTDDQDKEREVIPVVFYIYWDGSDLRTFLPAKGNPINMDTRTYIDIDGDRVVKEEDVEYLEKTGYGTPEKIQDVRPTFDVAENQLRKRIIIK